MFSARIDEDIELRLLAYHQAEALFALTDRNRAYLRTWLPWLDSTQCVEDTRGFIRVTIQQYLDNQGFQAGIWANNELVGVAGFHPIDWQNKVASLGYWLSEDYQGRGIMTRVCRTLVDHGFGDLQLNRIEIHCAVGNERSQGIPKRLGFKEEGILRQAGWLYDHFVDHVVYAMLAEEWPRT